MIFSQGISIIYSIGTSTIFSMGFSIVMSVNFSLSIVRSIGISTITSTLTSTYFSTQTGFSFITSIYLFCLIISISVSSWWVSTCFYFNIQCSPSTSLITRRSPIVTVSFFVTPNPSRTSIIRFSPSLVLTSQGSWIFSDTT